MHILRITGKVIYRTAEVFLLIVSTWVLMALLLPHMRLNSDYVPAAGGIKVYVHSNGVHTDFVLPVRTSSFAWDSVFDRRDFDVDSTYRWIAIGWGDKGFYLDTPTWDDLTFSTAFVAASGIGQSAVHATYQRGEPIAGERTLSFTVTPESYQRLVSYIRRSLQAGTLLINHPGYGYHDRFFEANGRYSLFKTCNEWTGDGMEEAGLPVGIWTPLEEGIMKASR